MDKKLKALPEVERVFGKMGRADTSTDPAPLTMIETTVLLKPKSKWRKGMTKEKLVAEMDSTVETIGYVNAWVQPIGLVIFTLMGCGSLLGWKKTSKEALRRNFRIPGIAFLAAIALHFAIGKSLGFPAIVFSDAIYPGTLGQVLRAFNAVTPPSAIAAASAIAFSTDSARNTGTSPISRNAFSTAIFSIVHSCFLTLNFSLFFIVALGPRRPS